MIPGGEYSTEYRVSELEARVEELERLMQEVLRTTVLTKNL